MPEPVPTSATFLPLEIQPVDELGEILAAEEKAGMEHRRPYAEAKACRVGGSDALAVENQMIGNEKNEAPHKTAEWPVRRSWPVETGLPTGCRT